MLATPVIVLYTFVPASHWNDIEWNPIDSDAVIFVNRSPDWPSPYYGIPDTPTSLVDRTADPKLGHTYTACATLGTETRCSESKYIGPSPVSAPDKPPPKITKTNVTGHSIEIV